MQSEKSESKQLFHDEVHRRIANVEKFIFFSLVWFYIIYLIESKELNKGNLGNALVVIFLITFTASIFYLIRLSTHAVLAYSGTFTRLTNWIYKKIEPIIFPLSLIISSITALSLIHHFTEYSWRYLISNLSIAIVAILIWVAIKEILKKLKISF